MPIWLLTTKNQKLPWFTFVQVTCHISLERSQWRLQLFFRPHFNWRHAQNVMGLQSCENPNFKNFKSLDLGILRQNDICVQPLWSSIKNTIRGKVVVSPKFGLWWVLWVCVCMWFIRALKMFQLHTNQLVV
jgi:hypothetical protein